MPMGTKAVSKPLAPLPPLGWNSWNLFGPAVDEAKVRAAAQSIVDCGLKALGYQYVVIDDCWSEAQRDGNGDLVPHRERFPNGIKALADHVHGLGLKLGIYSDAAEKTCGGYLGSLGFEEQDAKRWASWGIDYLKYDYCNAPWDQPSAIERYTRMGRALEASGRDIVFSLCEWGGRHPHLWGREAGGHDPERHEWKMRHVVGVKDVRAAPDACAHKRDRKCTARAGQRRRGKCAHCPQQHAAGKVLAQVIHLANQGDPGPENDRADACAKIGEDRPARASEPGAEAIGANDAGDQNCQAQQPCKFRPVGSDESEERGRDQKAADDGHNHRDVDIGSERRKRAADGSENPRRDQAIGFPSRKISFKTLPIGSVEHRRGSPAGDVERGRTARHHAPARLSRPQDQVSASH